jgi:hypothetical protein
MKKINIKKTIILIAISFPLMGISMCTKRDESDSLKRARAACIQAVRASLPEKATIIKTLDVTIQSLPANDKNDILRKKWNKIRVLPYIENGVDQKINSIITENNLSTPPSDQQIIKEIELTNFWKSTCSVQLKDEIQKCSNKFTPDGVDWKNCVNSSPLANSDWVGEWSPFWGGYVKEIRPALKEVMENSVGL